MSKRWLKIYLKISGINYSLKNKIINAENILKLLYYSLLTIVFQLIFSIFSLPIYILVSPEKVQEVGFIFPKKETDCNRDTYTQYCVRRKISLGTFFSAGTLVFFKIFFIGIVSFFLLGGQTLLALTQNWNFDTAGDYTYNSAKIEVTGGVAQLKNLTVPALGGTTNTGFDANTNGWTYVDWDQGTGEENVAGSRRANGGNPGGYVQISVPKGKDDELGGYYRQTVTTTVNNPTATLNFDWLVSDYQASPNTFKLLVFVDSASGAPTIGQEVWSSGEITATQGWTTATTVDLASKMATAGTYYVKIAVWVETPGSNKGPFTVGYDNIVLSWSAVGAPSYASDRPTINPTTSLLPVYAISWDSFTETATKNGGEIYYQLSDNDGATWQYWNNTAWAVAGTTNYNIASVINSNISSFPTTNNKLRWKAFLQSNGTQQVILDDVVVGYTENNLPDIANISALQSSETLGLVSVSYDLLDNESDPSSLVTYEYSLTGAFAGEQVVMTASTTAPLHEGTTGLSASPTGIAHVFVWDALADLGNIFDGTVYVRLRANDGIGSGAYSTSAAFIVDLANPLVSNVVALQSTGTTNVLISYDLSDDTTSDALIELEISNDSGVSWTVPKVSVTGDIGAGISAGTGKNISWDAGTDYDEQATSTMRVRVRARDKYLNQGDPSASSDFTLDTLNPANNVTADLQAQPNAGDLTVLIGGSFTEANPNLNDFYVAINGGVYNTATAGGSDTATPTNQATTIGATLDGNDYISNLKITHTDDYGQTVNNENLSPAVAYRYVKPYTPQAPSLSNPATTQLDLAIVPHLSEVIGLEYLIQETNSGNYVQANGTLGASPVWRADTAWGTVTVNGLSSPVSNYIFQVKSRNTSDTAHALSSESAYSATAQIANTAPAISIGSVAQSTDGTRFVTINYTGTDGQGDLNDLIIYEYSRDNSVWSTLTEKTGVGSDGISDLVFLSGGSAHDLMWDSGTDLSGVEDSSVYVRLRSNDGIVNSALSGSGAFEIDNISPTVANVSASQNTGAKTVAITYNLTDANNNNVELDISEDGGATWTVADTSVSGAVGAGVVSGTGKTITWNAGVDFSGQYQSDLRVRVRALDTFANQGGYSESANFSVDTKNPVVTNVSGVQNAGANTFVFTYDVSEDAGNLNIGLEISSNGGSTWTVPTTTALGEIGAGIVPGTGKTITWNAGTDYSGYEEGDMKIRISAIDQYTNSGNNSSANFSLDSLAPRVTGVSATQVMGSTNVSVTYSLAEQNNSLVQIEISDDAGVSWNVSNVSVSGDIGSSISAGAKTISWNVGVDFDEQVQADMRVRVRAKDTFEHQGAFVGSANFSLDTLNPATNVSADLQAQANAGDLTVLIGGSFTETNPNLNNFYVAINGGSYASATAGGANTASPANQATLVGATLDGNDYISAVKISHADDFGQTVDNENLAPAVVYKYVKPYTPAPPSVSNPTVGTVRVIINQNADETDGLEYAIYESTQNKFVQADGTLGNTAVWKTRGTGAGQWGESSGVTGGITVTGLVNDSYTYIFQTKSRNISDSAHLASSESALSTGASSANQSPAIVINSVAQTTDGTQYVVINYTGSDLESESSSLATYEYSLNNSTWSTMTEKAGVGSSGTSGLTFSFGGSSFNFAWDTAVDEVNVEDTSVYIRLRANDGTSNGNMVNSSGFAIDTKNPTISAVGATQTLASNNVVLTYTLADLSSSNVEIDISEDGGATWTVTDTSSSGDIGAGISAGVGKTITWNAGANFSGQEQSDIRSRVRARDAFGNQGGYAESANFSVDTKSPAVTNVSAVQNSGASTVTISYDLSDANNSNVEIDISDDGGASWNVVDTSMTGAIGNGVTSGTGKTISWNAGMDYSSNDQLDMRVRVRASDIYANASANTESANFSLDTLGPNISSVVASQSIGSENVVVTYNLVDNSAVTVAMDISGDGGATWTVADTSVTGNIGAGVTQGTGKTIVWNVGADFSGEDQADMRVRVRGADVYTNSSGDIESANFLIDTLAPTSNVSTDIIAQANAGDTTVTVGGSFVETNPNSNNFYIAINGGAYSAGQLGQANTASPANLATAVGVTLDGNDYISKVKINHTDDFAHSFDNENLSPNSAYTYVKPYTPATPSLSNPQNTSLSLDIVPNVAETVGLEYAVYESTTNKYVQTDGTLGTSAVWQTLGNWGTISVTGLVSPVANYSFQVKSRNTSDASNSPSSESSLSAIGKITNSAPTLVINSASQQNGGVNYVLINYTGVDAQNDTNNLSVYEYSLDNVNWSAMTEKAGVGSDGVSALIFATAGLNFDFAWNSGMDLAGLEDSSVYVRLRSSDTLDNSNLVTSSAFAVDNLGPSVSNISVSQNPGSNNFVFEYDVADNSGSGLTIEADISNDGGATWTVTDTSVTGNIGVSQTAGADKQIVWAAGTDFDNQEESDMQVRVRAIDTYGNQGVYQASSNFVLDTKAPVISNLSAVQVVGSGNVNITYDLSDLSTAGHTVELDISNDGGVTWTTTDTSISGAIGSGQSSGTGKTIVWSAGVDFANQTEGDMQVRVRSRDYFANQGEYVASANFSVDTMAPVTSNLSATQNSASKLVTISYNLADGLSTNSVELDISSDGGASWTTTDASVTGAIGAGVTAGTGKTISWDAGADFPAQDQTDLRVRVRAIDYYNNQSAYLESADFSVDTKAPGGLAGLTKFSKTDTSVTLNWQAGVTDSNFSHYVIWHGANLSDVDARTATANEWSEADDAGLSDINSISTVITGLSVTANYYAKIWAIDVYGNETTIPAINLFQEETEEEVIPETSAPGSSAGVVGGDTLSPAQPILSPLSSPTRIGRITISGLAEPRSRIDLYDQGILLARLISVTDSDGRFSQSFDFSEGEHVLTARAIDFSQNLSQTSGELRFIVDLSVSSAPVVQNYFNGQTITDATPQLFGKSEALSTVEIIFDAKNIFTVRVDENGDWSFILPNQFALTDGEHSLELRTTDEAGNQSEVKNISLTKIFQAIPEEIIPLEALTPSEELAFPFGQTEVVITPSIPLPSEAEIAEMAEAIELPGILVPRVVQVASERAQDIFRFSGTALPNKDVVVYIHSSEALMYRTKTDAQGVWNIDHSQADVELSSGEHSIFAVTIDTEARVKSRPSLVSTFEVKKSFWVMAYSLLNLPTTLLVLIISMFTMIWLYRIKKRVSVPA